MPECSATGPSIFATLAVQRSQTAPFHAAMPPRQKGLSRRRNSRGTASTIWKCGATSPWNRQEILCLADAASLCSFESHCAEAICSCMQPLTTSSAMQCVTITQLQCMNSAEHSLNSIVRIWTVVMLRDPQFHVVEYCSKLYSDTSVSLLNPFGGQICTETWVPTLNKTSNDWQSVYAVEYRLHLGLICLDLFPLPLASSQTLCVCIKINSPVDAHTHDVVKCCHQAHSTTHVKVSPEPPPIHVLNSLKAVHT